MIQSSLYALSAITILRVAGQVYNYFVYFNFSSSIFQPEYLLVAFAGLLLLKILKSNTNNSLEELREVGTVNYTVNNTLKCILHFRPSLE